MENPADLQVLSIYGILNKLHIICEHLGHLYSFTILFIRSNYFLQISGIVVYL